MLYLITGGARSGKSRYAQELALSLTPNPVYVATAKVWDADFEQRVRRHRQDRGPAWTSFEEQLQVSALPLEGRVAVVDCVTLWLTNFFMQHQQQVDACLQSLQHEIQLLLQKKNTTLIIVTNEIGMGVHAATETGRKFTDLQGWANQYIAGHAQKVILMVSGIPVPVK
ncbi:MAG TPA: bifunctional adenosylcobinamide kinase/adenosylcobinamide-phosphate guanylyltransferase [Chitinophaga sp.]|uniref:bifunctional adenosylcobinamide kinase/adenosylcobinamide-phosphate guanylyltransferase n=1 Tax=Chitinophaga sp. TaxID=1869181 RepID=UPI002DBD3038|nr:bifunctional adenosylcobinamide kinase/adenosylcobinamide-phosphate guanylyltransferase [Chitinophaga sp.]HEU4552133.1 bifunctional adenosylcobinamide kinase/adenosylcobinamide-phosphate guanylyltransferase [Chitinophaga sp.]